MHEYKVPCFGFFAPVARRGGLINSWIILRLQVEKRFRLIIDTAGHVDCIEEIFQSHVLL